ncbi:MAG: hypothetical protein BMS9Abin05_0159 [Rhodothermia bacterium]|nr:MAG: hypothetical protein BMS9Abin05_0159 [Rhodothermia bacterium]
MWVPAFAFAYFLLVQSSVNVLAQETMHVVTIADGNVLIDGKQVPTSELPPSLKIRNRDLRWSFQGDALLELNGTVYQLLDGKLVEADDEIARDGRVVVFFRDPDDENSMVRVLTRNERQSYDVHGRNEPSGVVMENYTTALNDKAKEFEIIRKQIAEKKGDQTLILAEKLQLQAENAARIAMSFPRVEFESYLSGIHDQNLNLYGELVREHDMEENTHRLAMEARAAGNAGQRQKIIEELRKRLYEAFELKQQNREQEIEQLASRLQELREKLGQRSDLRQRIIESRLKELLGELDW